MAENAIQVEDNVHPLPPRRRLYGPPHDLSPTLDSNLIKTKETKRLIMELPGKMQKWESQGVDRSVQPS
jgi:hypothetical protein